MSQIMTARLALAKHGFHFTHSLGQNFLLDERYISRIVDEAEISEGDCVLEIGAGAGVLTAELLSRGAKVLALELDKTLRPVLDEVLAPFEGVCVEFSDAMKADIADLAAREFGEGMPFKVVANLPYYITTDMILRLMLAKLPIESMFVLVQKEAAERITSQPNTKTWCALAATVQYFGAPSLALDVPPEAFTPRPHIDSCLLKIDLYREKNRYPAQSEEALVKLIQCAFAMRRKTLANNLTATYKMPREAAISILNDCGIAKNMRGEALTIKQIVVLADRLHNIQDLK